MLNRSELPHAREAEPMPDATSSHPDGVVATDPGVIDVTDANEAIIAIDSMQIVDGWRYGELLDVDKVDVSQFVNAPANPLT